jgi:hypothetical protein
MRLKQVGAYGIEALEMASCKGPDDPPLKGGRRLTSIVRTTWWSDGDGRVDQSMTLKVFLKPR